MAVCSPQDLLNVGKCFACLTPYQLELVKTALLCQILQNSNPVATCDAQTLLNSAKCLECLTTAQLALIQTQLLCEILGSGGVGGGTGSVLCSQASDPVTAPTGDCGLFYRRDNGNLWYWDSVLAQWILLIGG